MQENRLQGLTACLGPIDKTECHIFVQVENIGFDPFKPKKSPTALKPWECFYNMHIVPTVQSTKES